jgi:Protein of unknown function (DUF4229)
LAVVSTFWAYTLARLGVLAGAAGLLWLVGARGVLLIVLAFLVSMLVSYWALAGMRERLAAGVQARAERISRRIDEAARAEDDEVAELDPSELHEAQLPGNAADRGEDPEGRPRQG